MPQSHCDLLGGEAGVRALVDRFYNLMDTLPEAATIRALHPRDIAGSRDKLFKFLSGWLGGPPLYVLAHGHSMRARDTCDFPSARPNAMPGCCVGVAHSTSANSTRCFDLSLPGRSCVSPITCATASPSSRTNTPIFRAPIRRLAVTGPQTGHRPIPKRRPGFRVG